MNKQVEYEDFLEINKAGFIAETKNPYFRWKNKFGNDDYSDLNSHLNPETFITSEVSLQIFIIRSMLDI